MTENKSKKQPNLQIEVSNFGPISKTKEPVCVKPLTIFMGKSNTGKSYLAILLYALLKTHIDKMFIVTRGDEIGDIIELAQCKKLLKEYKEKELSQFNKILLEYIDLQKLQDFVKKYIYEYLSQWELQINRCLLPLNELIRSSQSYRSSYLKITLNDSLRIIRYNRDENDSRKFINPQWLKSNFKPSDCIPFFGLDLDDWKKKPLQSVSYKNLQKQINSRLQDEICKKLNDYFSFSKYKKEVKVDKGKYIFYEHEYNYNPQPNVHYFPASRTGIMQTHRVITKTAISKLSQSGYSHKDAPLSGGIVDFLTKLSEVESKKKKPLEDQFIDEKEAYNSDEELDKMEMIGPSLEDQMVAAYQEEISKSLDKIDKISDDLERNILEGEIDVKYNPVGDPSFIYKKDKLEISMLNASSKVTELAPIALFLKHHVRPGDTLIIEEPEAHLHPEAQQGVAKVLIALIKSGVKVILTTHSDILLQQISNYRMSESVSEKKRKNIMEDDLYLSEDEVAVYNFKPDEKGDIVVEHIPFDNEDGFSIEDHNEVSTQIYDQTIDIYDESHKNASKSSK